ADDSARGVITRTSHEREVHAQSTVAQGSLEIRGLYHRGRRPDPRDLDGPGHCDRHQRHRRPGHPAPGRRHGHPGLRRPPRLGVTGFCGGGALTLHFAAEYPGVAAAAPWYGHLKRTFSDAPGVDAFSLADKIKAPVLGLYGEADPGIPADDIKRFETELKKRS